MPKEFPCGVNGIRVLCEPSLIIIAREIIIKVVTSIRPPIMVYLRDGFNPLYRSTRVDDNVNLREVRIIPHGNGYNIEIVYKKEINGPLI